MPAPTNISFLTATSLTSIPQTITQLVSDAGTTYDVYFKIPASLVVPGIAEISAFGFGDLATYKPTTRVYLGPASAPTQIVAGDHPNGLNIPIQFPVTIASDYFLKVSTNAGNPAPANLTLLVQAAVNFPVQRGDIVIPDDTVGFPLAVLDPNTDYAIRRFIHPFSASEQGDTLHTSGHSLMLRRPADVTIDHLALYDETYTYTLGIDFNPAIGNTPPAIRSNQTTQKFWVAYFDDPTLYAFALDLDGVPSAVENMGTAFTGIAAVATSPDESILYFVEASDSVIKAWDLINHVVLPNVVAQDATHRVIDVLVLSDGTLVIGYYKSSATKDFNVKHYSAAGVLLHTNTFGSDIRGVSPRLAYSLDNLTTYWVYLPRLEGGANGGKSNVYQVLISDGSLVTDRVYAMFETGEYRGTATATPLADFGASNSCPFWIAGTGSTTTETFTIRRQRRFLLPSSPSQYRMSIPTLELLMRTGIGLLPDGAGSSTPLGVNPEVRMRISKDGGKTWGPERAVSAGARGEWKDRVRWLQATGQYRNAVCEITVDEPVDWQMLAMLGDPIEGSS